MRCMDFTIPDKPVNLAQLLQDCRDALKHQVKTGHPHFFNQLSSGLDVVSMAGEWLTATANTNMFTYEIAPVFIIMEKITLKKMREIIGWPNGMGDSILSPGGSISNLHALMAARHKMFPECKELGSHGGPELIMFTSEQSHYSIMGAACVVGLGKKNCVEIPTDERYRMIPEELERAILKAKAEGKTPFFVNATCGSTVIGAFDPINPIADICEKYGLWLHIDAAWGGGLLLSKKYRSSRFAGVERADSVTWNPHKLMGTLLQCSTIHLKHDGVLLSCNNMCAEYLFQPDKHYDISYDTGDKVIQCGRHNDIFKLWLMWRSRGTEGYEQQIDKLMELSEYFVSQLKAKSDKFHLLVEEPQCTNVCFWYIPKRLRGIPHSRSKEIQLGEIQAKLKQRMMDTGTVMVSYQPLGNKPNFFRNIVSNHGVRKEDIDFLVGEFDRLGEDL